MQQQRNGLGTQPGQQKKMQENLKNKPTPPTETNSENKLFFVDQKNRRRDKRKVKIRNCANNAEKKLERRKVATQTKNEN